jgi:putative Mn2+ efflux pump MntP
MGFIAISGIAISLAMDAFSVCIAAGVKIKDISFRHYFRLAFHFGLFQFFMPVLGFYSGVLIENVIRRYGPWVALTLLVLIGVKMLWESFGQEETDEIQKDPSRGMSLVMLSVATSIDAAAVGLSFAALRFPIFIPAIIIGIVCALFSAVGLYLGNKIGSFLGPWAERLGGAMLIAIGVKILFEHLL